MEVSPKRGLDRRLFVSAVAACMSGAAAGARSQPSSSNPGPIVETANGKLRGQTEGSVQVFRGVSYGETTAGEARFRPPRPVTSWTGVRDAVRFGARAPQGPDAAIAEVTAGLGREPIDEDCLFLNIWTPSTSGGRRPVLVWFHGGGYARGSGSSSWFNGSRLAEKHDVVVVTINHRLNAFGYLQLAELLGPEFSESGVAGMLDCIEALRWVKSNIGAFGGDPGLVTVFGQSGGAGKVSTLMGMPPAQGLFHRAVAMSGNALRATPPEVAARQTRLLLGKLGLETSQAQQLRTVPMQALVQASLAVPGAGAGPVTGNPAYPQAAFGRGAPPMSAKTPMILGSTLTEVTFFANTPLDPIDDGALRTSLKTYTGQSDADVERLISLYRSTRPSLENTLLYQLIASDWWMTTDQALEAERKTALGSAPAWLYRFEKTTPVHDGKLHVPHTLDIPYMFDTLSAAASIAGPGNQALADKMSAVLVAFARTGDPNIAGLPHWAPYDGAQRQVMVFDDVCKIVADPHAAERKLVAELKAGPARA